MFATGKPARHVVVELRDQHAPLALNREPASPRDGCLLDAVHVLPALGHPLEAQTHDRPGIKTQEDP
jgi:hypothetical protein